MAMMPMTNEELFRVTKLIGVDLFEYGDITVTTDDGRHATITKRELVALASGVTAGNVIATLSPPKSVDELTMADINNVTQAIIAGLADMLNKMGLLFRDAGGADGKEG